MSSLKYIQQKLKIVDLNLKRINLNVSEKVFAGDDADSRKWRRLISKRIFKFGGWCWKRREWKLIRVRPSSWSLVAAGKKLRELEYKKGGSNKKENQGVRIEQVWYFQYLGITINEEESDGVKIKESMEKMLKLYYLMNNNTSI